MPASTDPVNEIILLGTLEETPSSGYDISQRMMEELGGIVQVSSGTIYYTLKKLEARGWIKGSVSKQGRRPERRVYSITAAGKRGFQKRLEEAADKSDQVYSPFDVALFFTPKMSPKTLVKAAEKRLKELEKVVKKLEDLEEKNPGRWPFHLYYLHEKSKEIAKINEKWSQRLKKKLKEKTFQEA